MSLYAKSEGFEVLSNDLALRSVAIGRAFIANSDVKLSPAGLAQLFQRPKRSYARLAEDQYCPSVIPTAHARLLDVVLHNSRELPEPRRSLSLVLAIKWLLRVQPMSQLRGTDAKAAFGGDLDRVSPKRLRHYLNANELLKPEAWLRLMAEVNRGVFPGKGETQQGDAVSFLEACEADVVYLDPPYRGTTSYEREYAVLDHLLEGEVRPVSAFSRSPDLLHDLFAACSHIPVWLVSLNNAALSLPELEQLIRIHRQNVCSVEVPYPHLGSIASEEKNADNREFVILAW